MARLRGLETGPFGPIMKTGNGHQFALVEATNAASTMSSTGMTIDGAVSAKQARNFPTCQSPSRRAGPLERGSPCQQVRACSE